MRPAIRVVDAGSATNRRPQPAGNSCGRSGGSQPATGTTRTTRSGRVWPANSASRPARSREDGAADAVSLARQALDNAMAGRASARGRLETTVDAVPRIPTTNDDVTIRRARQRGVRANRRKLRRSAGVSRDRARRRLVTTRRRARRRQQLDRLERRLVRRPATTARQSAAPHKGTDLPRDGPAERTDGCSLASGRKRGGCSGATRDLGLANQHSLALAPEFARDASGARVIRLLQGGAIDPPEQRPHERTAGDGDCGAPSRGP